MVLQKALALLTTAFLLCPVTSLAEDSAGSAPDLQIKVSISSQSMLVIHEGKAAYEWPVSTAKAGKVTPKGSWTAKWLSQYHKSSLYNNAPMPYAIFYNGNFAVHGTNQIKDLGSPASSGCIRLHPEKAAILFAMAQEVGLNNTLITVVQ